MTDNSTAAPEMGPPALPIEPALYQKTLTQLQMRAICLDEASYWCQRESFDPGETSVAVQIDAEDFQQDADYSMFVTFSLEGKRDEQDILNIKAKYRLIFFTPEPIPQGFFEVFQEINLRLTTMPYFRELVSSTMSRMMLPVLTLPFDIYNSTSENTGESKER